MKLLWGSHKTVPGKILFCERWIWMGITDIRRTCFHYFVIFCIQRYHRYWIYTEIIRGRIDFESKHNELNKYNEKILRILDACIFIRVIFIIQFIIVFFVVNFSMEHYLQEHINSTYYCNARTPWNNRPIILDNYEV